LTAATIVDSILNAVGGLRAGKLEGD